MTKFDRKKYFFVLVVLMMLCVCGLYAQMPGGKPVQRTSQTAMLNGKEYYIHIVEQGQTVYAISHAYGVKDYDAVVKKDIHFLSVGDTVWIPVKKAAPLPDTPVTQSAPDKKQKATGKEQPKAAPAVIRKRIDPQSVVVSLMMPLYLNQINEISTTKFDVEQRGRKSYKQFEFVQFYEGVEMGLQQLQQQGYNVTLNVVDVSDNTADAVEKAWTSHNVAQSDFVITMLQKDAFERAALLAKQANVFIVNPIVTRAEVVDNNPYVVKCMPSLASRIDKILEYIQHQPDRPHLYIIHSGSSEEKRTLAQVNDCLAHRKGIEYSIVDWSANSKLTSAVKSTPNSLFLCLYDRGRDRNHTFVGTLLGKLSSLSSHTNITLATIDNWCDLYKDVDISFLQTFHYLTYTNGWDYTDPKHTQFLSDFRERYGVEPTGVFAALGYDVVRYFVTGVTTKGSEFWQSPNISQPYGALRPLSFRQTSSSQGFEASSPVLFQLVDYRFVHADHH